MLDILHIKPVLDTIIYYVEKDAAEYDEWVEEVVIEFIFGILWMIIAVYFFSLTV